MGRRALWFAAQIFFGSAALASGYYNVVAFWHTSVANPYFAYVSNVSSNSLSMYGINPSSGVLSFLSPSTISTGASPQTVATDPLGRFVYAPNNTVIWMYTINPLTGMLHATTPATIAGQDLPGQMTVDPLGRFAYMANTANGTLANVSMYTINRTLGAGRVADAR